MRCAHVLSALALRRFLSHCCQSVAAAGGAPSPNGLFAQSTQHITRALRQANARAWGAVGVIVAGETLWERAQLAWERNLDAEFYLPLRQLLDAVGTEALGETDSDTRHHAWRALDAGMQTGLLTSGALELSDLLPSSDSLWEPEDGPDAEWQALRRLGNELEQAGYAQLRPLLELRFGPRDPLLVVLVGVLFRHAVEADADLFGDLAQLARDNLSEALPVGLRGLTGALHQHRLRLDALLSAVRTLWAGASASPYLDADAGAARLQRGLSFAQRGEYEHAIAEYTAALQFDPDLAQAFACRGDARRLKGDYAQALADYDSAVKLDPANPLALLNRAKVHWLLGQHEDAVADYNNVLELQPHNAVAYNDRGKAQADAGNLEAAVSDFSEALRLDPYYPWAWHNRAEVYAARGEHEPALDDYSQALRLNPLSTLSYVGRGEVYRRRGEHERAVADFGNAIRLDPRNALAYLCRGMAQRELGRNELAVADFEHALALDPGNPRLFHQRGMLFRLAGEYDRAAADLNAAVQLEPGKPELHFERALTHQARGDLDLALADLTQALRLDPQYALAYTHRARLHLARNDTELALIDFDTAIRVDPAAAATYMYRAYALARARRIDAALVDCDKALQLDPDLSAIYLVRGNIQGQKGDYAAACEDFTRALVAEPHNAQAYYARGVAQVKLNNLPQAQRDLTEAIRLNPHDARAHMQRGKVYQMAGRSDAAVNDFADATRLNPQNAAAYCFQMAALHSGQGEYGRAVADYTLALIFDPNNTTVLAARDQALKDYQSRRLVQRPREALARRAAPPPARVGEAEPAADRTEIVETPAQAQPDAREKKLHDAPAADDAHSAQTAALPVPAGQKKAAETAEMPAAGGKKKRRKGRKGRKNRLKDTAAPTRENAAPRSAGGAKSAASDGDNTTPDKQPGVAHDETEIDLDELFSETGGDDQNSEEKTATYKTEAEQAPARPAPPEPKTPEQLRQEAEERFRKLAEEKRKEEDAKKPKKAKKAKDDDDEEAGDKKRLVIKWVAAAVVLLAVGWFALDWWQTPSRPSANTPMPVFGKKVTAEALWAEYAKNVAVANGKYQEEWLIVTGKVTSVDSKFKAVVLAAHRNPTQSMIISMGNPEEFAKVKPGEEVTIRAQCEGKRKANQPLSLMGGTVMQSAGAEAQGGAAGKDKQSSSLGVRSGDPDF